MNNMRAGIPALSMENIVKSYVQADRQLYVLKQASLNVYEGEIVALVGPSGAGKSTLLHLAGLLDQVSEGDVSIKGRNIHRLDDAGRTKVRRADIGFVYQFHHLLPEFTAQENVMMPQLVSGVNRKVAARKADHLLECMGLAARSHHRPAELSGGEQQRVAICRALANKPALLLADEPTGNLDPSTSGRVFDELLNLVRYEGVAALIATHNMELAHKMDRRVKMEEGRLIEV